MEFVSFLKREHDHIKAMLLELEDYANELIDGVGNEAHYVEIRSLLEKLGEYWDEHEVREERYFEELNKLGLNFPMVKMKIEHRQLRGHWKVIRAALDLKEDLELGVCLDTDGRMLIDKLRRHINAEESFFETLSVPGVNLST